MISSVLPIITWYHVSNYRKKQPSPFNVWLLTISYLDRELSNCCQLYSLAKFCQPVGLGILHALHLPISGSIERSHVYCWHHKFNCTSTFFSMNLCSFKLIMIFQWWARYKDFKSLFTNIPCIFSLGWWIQNIKLALLSLWYLDP